jgi:hypothetical protein
MIGLNQSTGAVTVYSGSPVASGAILEGNFWRVWFTFANGGTGATQILFYAGPSGTGVSDNSSSGNCFATHFQIEAGSYISSYIPTTSASATRSADNAYVSIPTPLPAWFNPSQFTAIVSGQAAAVADPTTNAALFDCNSGAEILVYRLAANAGMYVSFYNGTTNLATFSDTNANWGTTPQTVAFTFQSGQPFAFSDAGGAVSTTSASAITTPNTIYLGSRYSGGNLLNGTLKKVLLLPYAVSQLSLPAHSSVV